jgi:hypothetical protein
LGIKQNTRKIIKIPPCPTQSTTQQWELFEAAKLLEMLFMKLMQNGKGEKIIMDEGMKWKDGWEIVPAC